MMNGNNEAKTVIVIGAGIGGIATAARLARNGYRVTVVEKCEKPGGRCGQMMIEGHRFDTGSTIFMMPALYAETFSALGERMEDQLDLRRIDPTYHLYFQDNSEFRLTSNHSKMLAQLDTMEPGSYERLQQYIAEGCQFYTLSMEKVVNRDFRSLAEFVSPGMLATFLKLKALTRHTTYARRFFKTSKLQMAFTFQDMYMGLSPYESPATYSFLQSSELSDGLFYPVGGMYRIVEVLTAIAQKNGVQFQFNAPVVKILTDEGVAAGVEISDGRLLKADIIVANADLGYVYNQLLPDDGEAARIDRKEFGCSTVIFYWGLDKQYPVLGAHNLFFSGDYRKGFAEIFKETSMPEEPNFYIHAPTRMDPSAAPDGCDTLYAAVPVGHINPRISQDWPGIQARARSVILDRFAQVGLTDLEKHIKVEASFTPLDWQSRYNLSRGSVHGLSHRLTQMGYFRPQRRHKRFKNLYFVGASTHPGTGVPTVLVSARLTARRIMEETG